MDANLLPVHRAENQAAGAYRLLHTLSGHLGHDAYALARAEVDHLDHVAQQARRQYEAAQADPAQQAQRQAIIRLLNHPHIHADEKALGLAELGTLSAERAAAVLIGLKLDINAREGRVVFAEVLGYTVRDGQVVAAEYGVVGSAEVVQPACDCESDGCQYCVDASGAPLKRAEAA